jgi:hypothetical protein
MKDVKEMLPIGEVSDMDVKWVLGETLRSLRSEDSEKRFCDRSSLDSWLDRLSNTKYLTSIKIIVGRSCDPST